MADGEVLITDLEEAADISDTDWLAIDTGTKTMKIHPNVLKNIKNNDTAAETITEWMKNKLDMYKDKKTGLYTDIGGWKGTTWAMSLILKQGNAVMMVSFMFGGNIRITTYDPTDNKYSYYLHNQELNEHPIGSIYISTRSTNPGDLFGGTWERYAKGRALVGVDEGQEDFKTVEKTGGVLEHNLTHKHLQTVGADEGYMYMTYGDDGLWGDSIVPNVNNASWSASTKVGQVRLHNTSDERNCEGMDSGNLKAVDNKQPYITVYVFRRTA